MIISDKGLSVFKEVIVLHVRVTHVFVCMCGKGKEGRKEKRKKNI